jgi:pantoate--beta-alanine ligase
MQTIRDLSQLRRVRGALRGKVAFVPTMGALHAGHRRLMEIARENADHVIASIFVNPLQFAKNEDLSRYPRREEADAEMLADTGVTILWMPDAATMYPHGFATTVTVSGVSEGLCGASRLGHFDGVATVVAKLFGQIRPNIALFGEKDWQQLAVVRRMVIDLDLGISVIGVPTERDADGLALSSRNAYLSVEERRAAVALPQALDNAANTVMMDKPIRDAEAQAMQDLENAGFRIDYVAIVDSDLRPAKTLADADRIVAAAWIGTTRLIDNRAIKATA